MSERSTFLNAVIGAAVSVVFAFLPFSPVIGGAVSGYLEGGDYRDGAKVGAISGVIATVPIALLLTFVAAFFTIVPAAGGRMGVGVFFGFLFVVIVAFFLVYTVGLSALGGALGIALADEFKSESESEERPPVVEYDERPTDTDFDDRPTDTEYVEPPTKTTREERQEES